MNEQNSRLLFYLKKDYWRPVEAMYVLAGYDPDESTMYRHNGRITGLRPLMDDDKENRSRPYREQYDLINSMVEIWNSCKHPKERCALIGTYYCYERDYCIEWAESKGYVPIWKAYAFEIGLQPGNYVKPALINTLADDTSSDEMQPYGSISQRNSEFQRLKRECQKTGQYYWRDRGLDFNSCAEKVARWVQSTWGSDPLEFSLISIPKPGTLRNYLAEIAPENAQRPKRGRPKKN